MLSQSWNFPLDSPVSAVRLGPSGKVLVGAGSDAHVFDTTTTTGSSSNSHIPLEGLASPIASLACDKTCARVVAGTDGGSLRLWDANTRQTIRTFANAHRASITSVEYHPFGEFIATASRDTHVRIWDTRKKSCLQVYKAPGAGFMEVVRFSPDGRWAVSGCSNGVLRICDLMGGTLLHQLPSNNAPIVSISFHPTRCNIAVTGANGSLTIWDAEKFEKVYTTTNSGHTVCDFSERYLAWAGTSGKITKLAASDWSPRDSISDGTWKDQLDDIRCNETDGSIFAAKRGITGVSVTKFSAPVKRTTSSSNVHQHATTSPAPATQVKTPRGAADQPLVARNQDNNVNNNNQNNNNNNAVRYNHQFTSNRRPLNAVRQERQQQQQQQQQQRLNNNSDDEEFSTDDDAITPPPPSQTRQPQQQQQQQRTPPPPVTTNGGAVPPTNSSSNAPLSDDQKLDDALQKSDSMSALIQRRLTNTRVFRTLWQQHPDRALVHLEQTLSSDSNDCGTTIDFFQTLHHQRVKEKILIEHIPTLLRLVQLVLQNHRIETFVRAAMQAARYVNAKFRGRIEETLRGASHAAPGVDLSMETRVEKARTCYRLMMELRVLVSQYVARTDDVGEEARVLARDLPSSS